MKAGKKSYSDGCPYRLHSRIPISLKDAKAHGYTPSKVCHPAQ